MEGEGGLAGVTNLETLERAPQASWAHSRAYLYATKTAHAQAHVSGRKLLAR